MNSEWNSSVKDKWNTKSIYVVGKATAALGESFVFHFLPSLCFLGVLATLMLVLVECVAGTWSCADRSV